MISRTVRRRLVPVAGGWVLVLLALTWQSTENPLLQSVRQRLEWLAYDLRLIATLPADPSRHPQIIIVDIDEASLAEVGRWPWPRGWMAELIDRLHELGVIVIGTDMVFAEPQPNPAKIVRDRIMAEKLTPDGPVLATLDTIAPALDDDRRLAESLGGRDVVLGYMFLEDGESRGMLGKGLVVGNARGLPAFEVATMEVYTGNIAQLGEAASYGGFFNVTPDGDGVIRRANLIIRHQDRLYPSLGLEVARLFLLVDEVKLDVEPFGARNVLEGVRLDRYAVPTDAQGAALIPFRGRSKSFTYVSATDVLHGRIPAGLLDNTIALIGSSAKGLFDLRSTPVESVYPGVEVHATIIAGILDQGFPHEPKWSQGANFLLILFAGGLFALLFPFLSPIYLVAITLVGVAALLGFNLWLWNEQHLVLSIAVPLILVLLLGAGNMAHGFLAGLRGRSRLQSMFGQYVPAKLVAEMNRSSREFGFEGERRELTVLFADIRNFTQISERLSAVQLEDMLNRFFTPMTEIIFNRRGTIDKYVGDMIIAFGRADTDEQHSGRAIEAALQMLHKIEELRPVFRDLGLPAINIGIGLNTGVMNVGNMGSRFRRAYTVIGDAVNLAARLEGLTKYYGVGMIVGENTRRDQNAFVFRRLDLVTVKGKKQPVAIYEPVCRRDDASPELLSELQDYEEALDLYLNRRWAEAGERLEDLAGRFPGTKVYSLLLDRIASLQVEELGQDWDGVYAHTSK